MGMTTTLHDWHCTCESHQPLLSCRPYSLLVWLFWTVLPVCLSAFLPGLPGLSDLPGCACTVCGKDPDPPTRFCCRTGRYMFWVQSFVITLVAYC